MADTLLDRTLNKIDYMFRYSGMNLESSKKTRRENQKITALFIFNMVFLDVEAVGVIWWLIKSAEHGASFMELTYVAPVLLVQMLANVKSFTFLIYDKQVNEIINVLRKFEMQSEKERDDEIVKKETSLMNMVVKLLSFFNGTLLLIFPMMTLTLMAVKYYKTNKVVFMLPLIVEYPFDEFDIKIWPFVFLSQNWTDATVMFECTGVDLFFYVSTTFIRLHLKLLQGDIERCIADRSDFRLAGTSEMTHLVQLLKRHQDLLHCVDLVEMMYAKSMLYNFVSSSLMVCVCLFNSTANVGDIMLIQSFGSLGASLLQIFFLCLFGHLLMESSTEIGDSVYNSKWYLANVSVRKNLKIIQIRAQKPCKLTAFGFADVNLLAFTKILSTAWSYFALLQRLYD